MSGASSSGGQTFWDHLDILRGVLLKIIVVTVIFGLVAFAFKDMLFTIILAPKDSGFITYRWLSFAGAFVPGEGMSAFNVELINTGLAEQFVIHMKAAMFAGLLCASPYILYQFFRFVSPALYSDERRYAFRVAGWGYVMFIIGVGVSYFLIFPLTFRFLGTYQVSEEVANMISLQSYMDTLVMMSLAMGLIFEMPVLTWLFSRMGFISARFLRSYRRHAVVIILIVAAVITPTSDIFTLLAVSLPMWLLYEGSILLIREGGKKDAVTDAAGMPA